MMNKPLLSLCIPTNGIMELIVPVIDSIYSEKADNDLFEVVVMDNGNSKEFASYMANATKEHENLKYFKTDKSGFLNEIEAYKKASGEFIKFINHRTKLVKGAIEYFINFVKANIDKKPAIYFSDNTLKFKGAKHIESFDEYVRELGVYNTWSTGIAFWKSDMNDINFDNPNELFPHTAILFGLRSKQDYIVDNTFLLDEIPVSHANKGNYDIFYAFGVVFNDLTSELLKSGAISVKTFNRVKKELLHFNADLYYRFVIKNEPHSYDVSHAFESMNKYYSKGQFKRKVLSLRLKGALKH